MFYMAMVVLSIFVSFVTKLKELKQNRLKLNNLRSERTGKSKITI